MRIIELNKLSRSEVNALIDRSVITDELVSKVEEVIKCVKDEGDECLRKFLSDFYGLSSDVELRVSEDEFVRAYEVLNGSIIKSLEVGIERVKEVQELIKPKEFIVRSLGSAYVGFMVRPIDSVGIYVPGGRAPYPSTAIMASVPAKVAGVPKVVVCTPPKVSDGSVDPAVLVVLDMLGIKEVFRIGGAHAVTAMAYGTETVPKVSKVVGPGGSWVSTAKYLLKGVTDIDMIAGPSEVLILADEYADPKLIALDMVSQAEHDELATASLVTTSKSVAELVSKYLSYFIEKLPKPNASVVKESLSSRGFILITDDLDEAIEFINQYSPEHLQVIVEPSKVPYVLTKVVNAGVVLVGSLTPTALSDYLLGTNHVLPTSGWGRFRGGLSVYDFIKFIGIAYCGRKCIEELGELASVLARYEGFVGHALAIEERIKSLSPSGGGGS